MVRPRSSPEKRDGAENNLENNDSDRDGGGGGGNAAEDVAENLAEGVDSIEIAEREDLEVEAGLFGAEAQEEVGEEEDEDGGGGGKGASAFSNSASTKTNPEESGESGSRQRHASVQRVEHLHRFSLPAPPSADTQPIVNVLPGPVLPLPGSLPQGFEIPPLSSATSVGGFSKGPVGVPNSGGAIGGAAGGAAGGGFANMFTSQGGGGGGGNGVGSKFNLNRNADVKAKKSRNISNNNNPSDGGGSGGGGGAGVGGNFAANSGSPRSTSSLWSSRASQANLLAQQMHGGGASGGMNGIVGGGAGINGGVSGGGASMGAVGAPGNPAQDVESSPTPRRRNCHQFMSSSSSSSSNADHANASQRSNAVQNGPQNIQPDQQSQQHLPQLPPPSALQHQPSNFPQQAQNQQQLQLNVQQQQQQQQQQQHQQQQQQQQNPQLQNQPQNQLQQQQQQPPPPAAQRQQQQQQQDNNNNDGDRPNPFDLNNEMELGIGHMLKDRMASLCANDILADVEFIVGTPEGAVAAGVALAPPMGGGVRTIPAHKCILVTSSSVFYAMFCGGLASRSKDGDEIRVPDVDPEAFMAMLRYIYSEEINLEPESVLPTLYAAKKYMVNPLANECINYLEKNLKPENVCVILMQSKLYDEEELAEKCLREIDMHTEEVLNSEGFLEVDHDTLQSLVVRDGLSIPEIRLFEAVVRWAAAECLRRGLEPTPEQKRQMLGPVLHLIRIPTISLTDFSNHVSKSGLLTPEECVKMFQYFTADDKPGNMDFICEPRRKVGTERRCRRFPYFLHVSSTFYGLHSIAFKASRKVAIVGFGLYGWAQGCACHVVTAQLMYQGNVIAETHQRITAHCPEDEPTYRVKFDNPVEINADVLYSACVILNGAQSYYGMDGKERCEADGVTFQFLNSMDGSNGTNVEHGQIPEIIFTEPH